MSIFKKNVGSTKAKGFFFKGKTLDQLEKEMIQERSSPIKDDEVTRIAFRYVRANGDGVEEMRQLDALKNRLKIIAKSPEEEKKMDHDFDIMVRMLQKNFKL